MKSLSQKDITVIRGIELNSKRDLTSVVQNTNVSLEDFQIRLQLLRKKGVIGKSNAVINTTKLGFSAFGVFVKIKENYSAQRKILISYLKKNVFVYWISVNKQEYDVIFTVQARSIFDFNEFLLSLIEKFSSIFEKLDTAMRVQYNHFPRKYLSETFPSKNNVFWGKERAVSLTITREEKEVLNVLSTFGSISDQEISDMIKIPTRKIARIVQDFECRGIITGYHTIIYPENYGYSAYQALVTILHTNENEQKRFFEYCAEQSNVVLLVQNAGLWNYEITFEVKERSELGRILDEMKRLFWNIAEIKVIPVENYYEKYSLGYPSIKGSDQDLSLKDLEDDDFIILRELVRRIHTSPPFDFEYCEGYLLQATRNFPKVLYSGENIVFVTKKQNTGDSSYVIVFSEGFDRVDALVQASAYLYRKSNLPVILKNVDTALMKQLKKLTGFREYKESEGWGEYAKYDDNTFPQIIIHNRSLLNFEGPTYKNLREKLNWFDRRYVLEVVRYSEEHADAFDDLLERWARQMQEMHHVAKEEFLESHYPFREVKNYYYQYLLRDRRSEKWVGYLCGSACSESVFGFNALINDFGIQELYRKMMYKMIEISTRLGFSYTNLQGSETMKQYQTKEWFAPDRLIHKTHLLYEERR